MKLSPVQREVLRLMSSGWELGEDMGTNSHAWVQKGGLGRGGETKKVNSNTVYALWREKYIEIVKEAFPTRRFKLTEKGKKISRAKAAFCDM
jgi:hypothetical protein